MNKSSAFTFIEMLMVLLLVGVVASVMMPLITRRRVSKEKWSIIQDDCNNLVFFARQEAIANGRVHRLTFSSPKGAIADQVTIEEERQDPEKPEKKIYVPVQSYYFETRYEFDQSVKIRRVYVGRQETFTENPIAGAHCYIVPDGLVQDVIIQLTRTRGGTQEGGSLKMNPFFGKFEFEEGYVKPAA